jgi:hypothetical protein
MSKENKCITAEDCAGLEPRMFIVNHAGGESLCPEVKEWLDPHNIDGLGGFLLPKEVSTELHYHDYDEHWAWIKGSSVVTIRLPDGRSDSVEVSTGWIVYCPRGVEHGHQPIEDWGCYQWTSVVRPGSRQGHLHREL